MNQHEAPVGTVATLGHPANRILIAKGDNGWRFLYSGKPVDPEDFRAGWDVFTPDQYEDEVITGFVRWLESHGIELHHNSGWIAQLPDLLNWYRQRKG